MCAAVVFLRIGVVTSWKGLFLIQEEPLVEIRLGIWEENERQIVRDNFVLDKHYGIF